MGKLCGINVAPATPSATSFYQKLEREIKPGHVRKEQAARFIGNHKSYDLNGGWEFGVWGK